jgi:hypothetical protein
MLRREKEEVGAHTREAVGRDAGAPSKIGLELEDHKNVRRPGKDKDAEKILY